MARRKTALPPPKPTTLWTSRPQRIEEELAEQFLANVDVVTSAGRELNGITAGVSEALQELMVALRGRSKEEVMTELTEEFARRHATWEQHHVGADPRVWPEPQPPTEDEAEAVPPLPFDATVRGELLERIEAITGALEEVDGAIADLTEQTEEFEAETDELKA
jgi:hypothetical protein